jgi:copper homeostasis protein (lipoprotein)
MLRTAPLLLLLAACAGDRTGDPSAENEPRLLLHGTYRYMADAGSFAECLTEVQWPVAMSADNIALERGYREAGGTAGEPMLVHLEGRVVLQPAMEGDTMVPTLIVDRFLSAEPGGECAPLYITSPDSGDGDNR